MGDLSALIFVALAIAWAAYLIPKALQHHEEAARERPVDRFSERMRVLAHRGATAGLVGAPAAMTQAGSAGVAVAEGAPAVAVAPAVAGAAAGAPEPRRQAPVVREPEPIGRPERREVARRAARRRRRVLGILVLTLVGVGGAAGVGLLSWWYAAAPAALLALWLVACRVTVRRERRTMRRVPRSSASTRPAPAEAGVTGLDGAAPAPADEPVVEVLDPPPSAEPPAVAPAAAPVSAASVAVTPASSLWDPVPMTLPTYVTKPPAARRTVRTIDLDDTGVWTSGRTRADAALVREADATPRPADADETAEAQAVGS